MLPLHWKLLYDCNRRLQIYENPVLVFQAMINGFSGILLPENIAVKGAGKASHE
jgi:hypothetical protein